MPQYKIKFNRWRGPENAVLSWGKTNEAIMEESLFVPTSPYGDLKREVLVVNVPFEFILREGSKSVRFGAKNKDCDSHVKVLRDWCSFQ